MPAIHPARTVLGLVLIVAGVVSCLAGWLTGGGSS